MAHCFPSNFFHWAIWIIFFTLKIILNFQCLKYYLKEEWIPSGSLFSISYFFYWAIWNIFLTLKIIDSISNVSNIISKRNSKWLIVTHLIFLLLSCLKYLFYFENHRLNFQCLKRFGVWNNLDFTLKVLGTYLELSKRLLE